MIIQWVYGAFDNGSDHYNTTFRNNSISGLYAKSQSCKVNTGPVLLNAGDKIKIISKAIGGTAPFITRSQSVRLRITKTS